MALIGSISGSVGNPAEIPLTGSLRINGGAGPFPTAGTDTFMAVSGTMGSKGTAVPGTAVFGGDLVVSGGITHTHNPLDMLKVSNDAYGDVLRAGVGPGGGVTTAGKLYYFDTDTHWELTDADAVTTGGSQLLGIALGASPVNDGMLISGYIKLAAIVGTENEGLPLYVATETTDAAGDITVTAPSGPNDFVRLVGWCIDDAGTIYFRPSNDWIKLL